MEKSNKLKNVLAAVAVMLSLVALLCVFSTLDSAALDVPTYNTNVVEFSGKGNLNAASALILSQYMEVRYKLGYYEIPDFFLVGRLSNSGTMRLYTSNANGKGSSLLINGNSIVITGFEAHDMFGDSISGGSGVSGSATFDYENVLCFVTGGVFTSTVNAQGTGAYAYGTLNFSDALAQYYIDFTNFANKILAWDGVTSTDGYDEGFSDGYDEGRSDGYDEGFSTGQTSGYNTGYNTGLSQGRTEGYQQGYEAGFADGEAEGGGGGVSDEELEQEYQRGYEIGYREGTDYGYEQGYNRGAIEATPNEVDVEAVITAIPQGVREILDTSLGFEIFGFNVAATIVSIIVVIIIAFVVKKVLLR